MSDLFFSRKVELLPGGYLFYKSWRSLLGRIPPMMNRNVVPSGVVNLDASGKSDVV